MKILYLDKEDNQIENLKHLLGSEFMIERFENVTQAIRAMLTSRFDIVVSDIFLEDLDGYDLLKLMRKFNLQAPVVFYTQKDDELEKAIAENEGALKLVKKGNTDELQQVLDGIFVAA